MDEEKFKLDKDGFVKKHDKVISDEQVVNELNQLDYYRKRYNKQRDEWKEVALLCLEVIDGYKSLNELKKRGYVE